MDATRKCPYCAEEIAAEAVRCRYCRSRLAAFDPERWYRDHPERRLAGVAVAISRALAFPVSAVRLGFIVLSFFHFLGPLLYGALWLIIPFAPGGDSPLEHGLDVARRLAGQLRGKYPPSAEPRGPASGPQAPGGNGKSSLTEHALS